MVFLEREHCPQPVIDSSHGGRAQGAYTRAQPLLLDGDEVITPHVALHDFTRWEFDDRRARALRRRRADPHYMHDGKTSPIPPVIGNNQRRLRRGALFEIEPPE